MYDGANALRWNFEVEPFIVWWIVQMEEDTCKLGVVKDHMSPWGVIGKKKCVIVNSCQGFKKEGTLINHKPNNYDWGNKGPTL
jgi:hypothetical protein